MSDSETEMWIIFSEVSGLEEPGDEGEELYEARIELYHERYDLGRFVSRNAVSWPYDS